MDDDTASRKLILTQQGQRWLSQFDPLDQDAATLLASSLALVSHNEFRRKLEDQINEAATAVEGPVALFAVRELPKHSPEPWMTPTVQAFYSCAVPSADGRSVNPLESKLHFVVREKNLGNGRSDQLTIKSHPIMKGCLGTYLKGPQAAGSYRTW